MAMSQAMFKFIGFNPTGDLDGFTFYTTKRGKTVWFEKAPPTCPPSYSQGQTRMAFTWCGELWSALAADVRANWELASKRLSLRITGYNLWIYFQLTADINSIRTIERQSGLELLD